jgi:glutamate racemase
MDFRISPKGEREPRRTLTVTEYMSGAIRKSRSLKDSDKPIGIFDSGVGGLTVAKRIFELLPGEKVIYFGDTGRYPYGPRSPQIVRRFSAQNVEFLLRQKVKFIVVACNTASAVALPELKVNHSVPMIGVIEPGASAAVRTTQNRKVGVIGTVGTISSQAYRKAIHSRSQKTKVFSVACPLFVALAEEGYVNKKATRLIAEEYLTPLVQKGVDTLVLGCTHYPLLKKVISQVMGEKVKLIDSAEETAKEVKTFLASHGLLRRSRGTAFHRFFVSDVPDRFVQVGQRFLKSPIRNAKKIDLDR